MRKIYGSGQSDFCHYEKLRQSEGEITKGKKS